jgi:hypothetical protein
VHGLLDGDLPSERGVAELLGVYRGHVRGGDGAELLQPVHRGSLWKCVGAERVHDVQRGVLFDHGERRRPVIVPPVHCGNVCGGAGAKRLRQLRPRFGSVGDDRAGLLRLRRRRLRRLGGPYELHRVCSGSVPHTDGCILVNELHRMSCRGLLGDHRGSRVDFVRRLWGRHVLDRLGGQCVNHVCELRCRSFRGHVGRCRLRGVRGGRVLGKHWGHCLHRVRLGHLRGRRNDNCVQCMRCGALFVVFWCERVLELQLWHFSAESRVFELCPLRRWFVHEFLGRCELHELRRRNAFGLPRGACFDSVFEMPWGPILARWRRCLLEMRPRVVRRGAEQCVMHKLRHWPICRHRGGCQLQPMHSWDVCCCDGNDGVPELSSWPVPIVDGDFEQFMRVVRLGTLRCWERQRCVHKLLRGKLRCNFGRQRLCQLSVGRIRRRNRPLAVRQLRKRFVRFPGGLQRLFWLRPRHLCGRVRADRMRRLRRGDLLRCNGLGELPCLPVGVIRFDRRECMLNVHHGTVLDARGGGLLEL